MATELNSAEASRADDEGARWFARRRVGPLSESETEAFATWLKAHPANTVAWSSYERLWAGLQQVRDDPKLLAMRESARRVAELRSNWLRWWRIEAALAASLLVVFGLWWTERPSKHATGAADSVASLAQPSVAVPPLVREASTGVGERSLLLLSDGSKVTLNTASEVQADYSGRDRRLTLVRGEAFFEVAKDAARPFIVSAGTRQVVAVGTAFNIRLQPKEIKVTLVEGKVRVIAAPNRDLRADVHPVLLEAGSALVVRDDGAEQVKKLDADRATSWRTGRLVFDGELLTDVIAEMNRYSTARLTIGDPALEGLKVSGVFEPSGGSGFAQALEAYGIARVARQTTSEIVLESPR